MYSVMIMTLQMAQVGFDMIFLNSFAYSLPVMCFLWMKCEEKAAVRVCPDKNDMICTKGLFLIFKVRILIDL